MPNVIAVGVDGSGPSVVALRWALRLAEVHGAELTAVIARPPTSDPSRESPAELAARTAEIEQHLAQVSRTIAETAQGAPVTVRSLEGNPTDWPSAPAPRCVSSGRSGNLLPAGSWSAMSPRPALLQHVLPSGRPHRPEREY